MREGFISSFKGQSPLVLSMPHSGFDLSGIPAFVTENLRSDDPAVKRTFRMGVDVGVPASTDFHDLPNDKHTRIMTTLPRVALDVNRAIGDVDGLSVEGQGDPAHAHGLIWRATGEVVESLADASRAQIRDLLKRPYTEAEFQLLLNEAYHPYVRAVRAALERAVRIHGFGVMLDLHTFPGHTATKMPADHRHANAYLLGPKAQRAPVSNVADLMAGKMPDLFMIADFDPETGQPKSCHPRITDIIREEFEDAGLYVTPGFGPSFQGNTGSVAMYRNPVAGQHVVALELVGHDLEPNRAQGTLEVNQKAAARFRPIYARIFRRLAALKEGDVKMAA